jgi:hypothetical protein
MAGKWDLTLHEGADFSVALTWGTGTSADDIVPIDLTGAEVVLRIAYGFSKVLEVVGGKIQLHLTGAETASLQLPTDYLIEVTMPGGEVDHVLEGAMVGSHHQASSSSGGGWPAHPNGLYPSLTGRPGA